MSVVTRDQLRRATAPGLLLARADREPDAIAYRTKKLGLYRDRTWRDYAANVGRIALGLRRLGLVAGDRVAIMGEACEEWIACDLAAQAAGAVTYGIYPTASNAALDHQMRDGGAAIFIAENQEYIDRILPLVERLPALRAIIVIDASAMFGYAHPKLGRFDEVVAGIDDAAGLTALRGMVAALDPAAPAVIAYSAGTTGDPRGAVVAHGRHLAAAHTLVELYPILARPQRTVVYLPLCHPLGRDVAITLPLISRLVPHFGESIDDLVATLIEVAPTVLFAVPRYLQKFAAQILVGITGSSPLKRHVYELALRRGRAEARRRWDGRQSLASRALYRLLRTVAFRPILAKIGFSEITLLISGDAPLSPATAALWQIYGVNLVETYSQTEAAGGIIAGQKGPFARPGDAGTVPDGWEIRIAGNGEILMRSADLVDAYWPESSGTARDPDGWLHTGDVGALEEGRLRLIGRTCDFIVTQGGKTLSPAAIENALRASPYIAEAVVLGHGSRRVTALIEIDFDTVAQWAADHEVAFTGFTSLTQRSEVRALLRHEIDRANATLAEVEQVEDFRILPSGLDPGAEDAPVTPTRKVKRALIAQRFRALIAEMDDDEERATAGAALA